MDLPERLQQIVAYSRLSVRALAIKCGLKQQTLDKYIKGGSEPSANTLIALASTYPEISADWLLLGNGPMLREGNNKDADRLMKLVDTITTLQDTINIKEGTIANLKEKIKLLEAKANV